MVSPRINAEDTKAVPLVMNGIDGVWMPRDLANKVAADVESVPLLKKKIEDLELLAAIRSERFENAKLGLEIAETGKKLALEKATLDEQRRIDAEEKLKAWYRHPILWLGVGIVIAVSAETALIVAAN
jgi:hypothetical protein